jgi:hypothetical protein
MGGDPPTWMLEEELVIPNLKKKQLVKKCYTGTRTGMDCLQ